MNNEVIMGDSDKHLDVRVSICRLVQDGKESVVSTTVVHIRNFLGRVYMLFVVPFHKLIVLAALVQACK